MSVTLPVRAPLDVTEFETLTVPPVAQWIEVEAFGVALWVRR